MFFLTVSIHPDILVVPGKWLELCSALKCHETRTRESDLFDQVQFEKIEFNILTRTMELNILKLNFYNFFFIKWIFFPENRLVTFCASSIWDKMWRKNSNQVRVIFFHLCDCSVLYCASLEAWNWFVAQQHLNASHLRSSVWLNQNVTYFFSWKNF